MDAVDDMDGTPPHGRDREGGGRGKEEQGTWASQKHSEAGYGRPVDRGVWTAKTVKRPRQQPAHPQYANYWAPLTRKRHIMPHSAQSQHTNYWAPRTRKRHQQEHRSQRPTESSNPTQHVKGRTGDRPGPRKGATTRRNVTQGEGGVTEGHQPPRLIAIAAGQSTGERISFVADRLLASPPVSGWPLARPTPCLPVQAPGRARNVVRQVRGSVKCTRAAGRSPFPPIVAHKTP